MLYEIDKLSRKTARERSRRDERVHISSPYPQHRSAVTDCEKLVHLDLRVDMSIPSAWWRATRKPIRVFLCDGRNDIGASVPMAFTTRSGIGFSRTSV
jgi:hypothetical protein